MRGTDGRTDRQTDWVQRLTRPPREDRIITPTYVALNGWRVTNVKSRHHVCFKCQSVQSSDVRYGTRQVTRNGVFIASETAIMTN